MITRETILKTLMEEFPIVVITGPRQVGKTTLVKQFVVGSGLPYVMLDMELASDKNKLMDIEAWFDINRNQIIVIDEVQFKPEIFSALRPEIDALRKPGRFLLTGSANPSLIKGVAESLAGRAAYMELTPFSFPEVKQLKPMLYHWFRGGYPEAYLAKTNAAFHRWMEQYISSFVQTDLPIFFGGGLSSQLTRNLWQMLAYNNGSVLNTENFARALGVSAPTVKKYLQLLEGTFLIRFLMPWFVNANKRLIKSPKVYIRDSGILHHLNNIENPEDMPGHLAVGASWEGYVIEEICRQLPHSVMPFFYRTQHGAEIDLLLVKNNKPIVAIEIKHSRAPKLTDGYFSSINDLEPTNNFLIYSGNDEYPAGNKVTACGLQSFLEKHLPAILKNPGQTLK